jgi:magnesium chelatase subunit I
MPENLQMMPYSMIVGQRQLKLALELAYIAPRIGGVLLSGQRGTGKSTVVRAFGMMVHDEGKFPVTLPINATEDRVVGGWDIDKLLQGELVPQIGLLEEADGGLLYIDEINLLDDHIINIILDVTSTGVLVIEREGKDERKEVRFIMVGTMNPAEGGLRPQLLDRFGLMADVVAEEDEQLRTDILETVLDYDAARILEKKGQEGKPLEKLQKARTQDKQLKQQLRQARTRFEQVILPREIAECCVKIGKQFQIEGHRGDYIMALAARACAALRGSKTVGAKDVLAVAPLALQHRRTGASQGGTSSWTNEDTDIVKNILKAALNLSSAPAKSAESPAVESVQSGV